VRAQAHRAQVKMRGKMRQRAQRPTSRYVRYAHEAQLRDMLALRCAAMLPRRRAARSQTIDKLPPRFSPPRHAYAVYCALRAARKQQSAFYDAPRAPTRPSRGCHAREHRRQKARYAMNARRMQIFAKTRNAVIIETIINDRPMMAPPRTDRVCLRRGRCRFRGAKAFVAARWRCVCQTGSGMQTHRPGPAPSACMAKSIFTIC